MAKDTHDATTTATSIAVAAAPTAATCVTITKECVVGGPITCVALLRNYHHDDDVDHDDDGDAALRRPVLLYYGQGPYLHCTSTTILNTVTPETRIAEKGSNGSSQRLLVFPHGGSIHGIRHEEYIQHNDDDDDEPQQRTKLLLVFGGRQIAFVQQYRTRSLSNDCSTLGMKRLPIDQQRQADAADGSLVSQQQSQHLTVTDWIWDCRLHRWDADTGSDDGGERVAASCVGGEVTLWVGLAHNTVQVWSVRRVGSASEASMHARLVRSIQGTTRSISYCMDILGRPHNRRDGMAERTSDSTVAATIAVGTVTNEILVWTLWKEEVDTTRSGVVSIQQRKSLEHHLPGHEGVIHAVRWCRRTDCDALQRLVSTSDDRSVRLWTQPTASKEWVLQWTGWGHTARGWDVAWGQTLSFESITDVVLSTGEDGTMRVWDVETGAALAVVRGHACKCVWRVDTAMVVGIDCDAVDGKTHGTRATLNMAVTGGNDGTVAFYNLEDRIQRKHPKDELIGENAFAAAISTHNTSLPCSWKATFLVPDDRPTSARSDEKTAGDGSEENVCDGFVSFSKKKEKRKSKLLQQVIVGMQFTKNVISPSLVVATRSGSLTKLDPAHGEWTRLQPWCKSDTVSVDASQGCCMALHPRRSVVAIGTQLGDIVVTTLTQQSIKCNGIDLYPSDNLRVLVGREHRAVQRLEWLSDTKLLSFHVQSIVMWTFHAASQSETEISEQQISKNFVASTYSSTILRPGVTGMAICYAHEMTTSSLVVGDTRGCLTLFHIPLQEQSPGIAIIMPASVKSRVHAREHVTAVRWQAYNRILSVGHDGHLVESTINNGQIVKLLSVPIGSFTGLTGIWSYGGSGVVVGGYYGNKFALVDVDSGYEYCSFDTGGRQRHLSLSVEDQGARSQVFSSRFYAATSVSRKDGCNEVEILRLGRLSGAGSQCLLNSQGVSLHGESIFDLSLFALDPKCKKVALLTGSEDCTSKISIYENGIFSSSKLLPPHASGIRAVCVCTLTSGSVIMVVGGKVEIQLFLMNASRDQVNGDRCLKSLGFGRPPVQPTVDQRLNAVKVVQLDSNSESDGVLLAVTGDSSGSCFLYRFYRLAVDTEIEVCLLYQDERPILAVDIVKYETHCILLLGTTSGDIVVYCLPGTSDLGAWDGISNSTSILRYSAHSMGANTISARLVEVAGHHRLRICSGGDDQSIYCCDVALANHLPDNALEATILETCCEKNAARSALKGIEFIGDHHLVATGYDQRISVWQLGQRSAKLSFVSDAAVDVGDINCLACCHVGMGRHLLAAGGAGVEFLSIDLNDAASATQTNI